MSFTLIEYEQYTEASAYGDAETCHEIAERSHQSTLDTITSEEYSPTMSATILNSDHEKQYQASSDMEAVRWFMENGMSGDYLMETGEPMALLVVDLLAFDVRYDHEGCVINVTLDTSGESVYDSKCHITSEE